MTTPRPHFVCCVDDNEEQFDEFVRTACKDIEGTVAVYIQQSQKYCNKYPGVSPLTITFTLMNIMVHCSMSGMLAVVGIEEETANKWISEAVDKLTYNIHNYANKKLDKEG